MPSTHSYGAPGAQAAPNICAGSQTQPVRRCVIHFADFIAMETIAHACA